MCSFIWISITKEPSGLIDQQQIAGISPADPTQKSRCTQAGPLLRVPNSATREVALPWASIWVLAAVSWRLGVGELISRRIWVTVRPTTSSNRHRISRPCQDTQPIPSWRPHHVSVSPPRLLVGRGRSVSPVRFDAGRLLPHPPSLGPFLPPMALPPRSRSTPAADRPRTRSPLYFHESGLQLDLGKPPPFLPVHIRPEHSATTDSYQGVVASAITGSHPGPRPPSSHSRRF